MKLINLWDGAIIYCLYSGDIATLSEGDIAQLKQAIKAFELLHTSYITIVSDILILTDSSKIRSFSFIIHWPISLSCFCLFLSQKENLECIFLTKWFRCQLADYKECWYRRIARPRIWYIWNCLLWEVERYWCCY